MAATRALLALLLLLLLLAFLASLLVEFDFRAEVRETAPPKQTTADREPCAGSQATFADTSTETAREALRVKANQRILSLTNEHRAVGTLQAIGLRGVSFVFYRFGGALLGSEEVYQWSRMPEVKLNDNMLRFTINNLAEGPCVFAKELNRVSIWVRAAGPEIVAGLAQPIVGKCSWNVELPITVPGNYTIYARLLHYNAESAPRDSACAFVNEEKLAEHRLVVIGDALTHPYHMRGDDKCCVFCNRIPDCEWSMRAMELNTTKIYGVFAPGTVRDPETRCLFFRNATHPRDLPVSVMVKDVYEKYGIARRKSDVRWREVHATLGLMHDPLSYTLKREQGEILQLGCGRDEMLLKWATCGSSGSVFPPNIADPLMPLTEDIVIFEQEGKVNLRPRAEASALEIVTRATLPRDSALAKPVCKWSEGIPTSKGRWVRVPSELLRNCTMSFHDKWQGSNNNVELLPRFDRKESILCTSVHFLEKIPNPRYMGWGEFDIWDDPEGRGGDQHVWRSELSDSYSWADQTSRKPYTPGPVAVKWILNDDVPCRLPPWRSSAAIQQCLTSKRIGHILVEGYSIAEWAAGSIFRLVRNVFPKEVEFSMNPWNITIPSLAHKDARTVYITNLKAPHHVGRGPVELAKNLASDARSSKSYAKRVNAYRKIYFTPGFSAYERWAGQHFGEFRFIASELRKLFPLEESWVGVDYEPLTVPFFLETTPEMDSLHHIGPPLNELSQLLMDIICTDEALPY